jgi:hypothetical protein
VLQQGAIERADCVEKAVEESPADVCTKSELISTVEDGGNFKMDQLTRTEEAESTADT